MMTWTMTFLVEPWPDTPWDRRDLERWQQDSSQHTYTIVKDRRNAEISTTCEAPDEATAIAAGRAQVDAFFPRSRYAVQNPQVGPATDTQRMLKAGAALFLRNTAATVFRKGATE
ncbi:MAG TPA: hypothetical protein VIU62_09460 [Chloroflexota bacterium]